MITNELMPISLARFVAIAGDLFAGVLIVNAHRRRPELQASEVALSMYFTVPTRATMTAAYAAIMTALASTAFVLAKAMQVETLVAAVACCVGAMLLVPVVATTQREATIARSDVIRRAHRYSAMTAYIMVGVAMAESARMAINEANGSIAIFGSLGAVLVIRVLHRRSGETHGLWQRLLLVTMGLWIVAVAVA